MTKFHIGILFILIVSYIIWIFYLVKNICKRKNDNKILDKKYNYAIRRKLANWLDFEILYLLIVIPLLMLYNKFEDYLLCYIKLKTLHSIMIIFYLMIILLICWIKCYIYFYYQKSIGFWVFGLKINNITDKSTVDIFKDYINEKRLIIICYFFIGVLPILPFITPGYSFLQCNNIVVFNYLFWICTLISIPLIMLEDFTNQTYLNNNSDINFIFRIDKVPAFSWLKKIIASLCIFIGICISFCMSTPADINKSFPECVYVIHTESYKIAYEFLLKQAEKNNSPNNKLNFFLDNLFLEFLFLTTVQGGYLPAIEAMIESCAVDNTDIDIAKIYAQKAALKNSEIANRFLACYYLGCYKEEHLNVSEAHKYVTWLINKNVSKKCVIGYYFQIIKENKSALKYYQECAAKGCSICAECLE